MRGRVYTRAYGSVTHTCVCVLCTVCLCVCTLICMHMCVPGGLNRSQDN